MDCSQFDGEGPPSAATLAAESTADQPPLLPRAPWPELNKGPVHLLVMYSEPRERDTCTVPKLGFFLMQTAQPRKRRSITTEAVAGLYGQALKSGNPHLSQRPTADCRHS
jgi:hypothetical protein